MKYVKRPIVIEAEQFLPEPTPGPQPGRMFMEWPIQTDERGHFIIIPTLEGSLRAEPGDWIITGIKGEKYPCKPDIFAATYQCVEEKTPL